MQTNHQHVDQRLSEFRKKYYTDKILRGSLILALVISSIAFIVLVSEGLFGFSSSVRTGIVLGLGMAFLGVLGSMILWPMSQLFNWTKNISDLQIAHLVKRHFPDINDKLINFLQLKNESAYSNALVTAALDQKAAEISPVPLSQAINLNVNKRYLWYLLIPLALFLITYVSDPSFLSSSSHRLINYNQNFIPPAPFQISLGEIPDEVVAGNNLQLDVQVSGNELPAELSIFLKRAGESQYLDYPLEKESPTDFAYTISDVKENFSLYIGNPEVSSSIYNINVLKRPFIKKFNVQLIYPKYTNLDPEILEDNIGDIKVIKGTRVKWILNPQGDIQSAQLVADKRIDFSAEKSTGNMAASRRVMKDMNYFISLLSQENISNIDTVRYQVDVFADRHPSIYVYNETSDYKVELDPRMPLELEVSDDFGFTKMELHYRFVKSGGTNEVTPTYRTYPLGISPDVLLQPLSYQVDLTELGLREGDEVEYFIKVWDNDGISGPKFSISPTYNILYPTLDEKYEEVEAEQEEVKAEMEKLLDQTEQLDDAYRKMQEKLLDKSKLNFDDKKEIQKMMEQHQEVMEQMKEAQEQFEKNKDKLEENQMISEETLEKFDELNEFMEELENPEIEELLKELQEQMENLNPEDIKENLEKLQLNDEELKKSLERTLELMKQLEVQQKIDEMRNKLDNMKAKEDILNERLENAEEKEELEQNAERQEELKEQMEELQKEMEELGDKKEETSTPDEEKMDELGEKMDEAQEEMENAAEQTEQAAEKQDQKGKQNKKESKQSKQNASQSQKKASQKMQEMSEMLGDMQMDMQMQQDQQNLESLRELLENLLTLSFDQEDLRDDVKGLRYGDPALGDKSKDQKKLQDDMLLVKDSLEALASKVFMIQKEILDETQTITQSMEKSQRFFRNKQVQMVTYHQQTAMTSINNLANMLSGVMQQIQQQMMSAMPSGMCQKPGENPGQKSMQNMTQQQRQLNQQMQQMMDQMKKMGQMDGDALQEMAARQRAIREQLEKSQQQMQKEGEKGLGDMGKIAQDMKESEQELINKQLTQETLMRQQQILSRLLQADQSIREREYENKRESKTGRNYDQKAPEELTLEEYKNKIRQELLKSNKLEYSSDFIILIEEYFKKLEQTNE